MTSQQAFLEKERINKGTRTSNVRTSNEEYQVIKQIHYSQEPYDELSSNRMKTRNNSFIK